MAVLSTNEMFFTAFEPKQQNRFVMYIDGFPSYLIKGVSSIQLNQDVVNLNHINVRRNIKGKSIWQPVTFTLFDPITPSGAQAVMEWVRLHHESVTGRDVVSEWILKGSLITNATFGDYSYDNESAAQELTMTVEIDYAVLNF